MVVCFDVKIHGLFWFNFTLPNGGILAEKDEDGKSKKYSTSSKKT